MHCGEVRDLQSRYQTDLGLDVAVAVVAVVVAVVAGYVGCRYFEHASVYVHCFFQTELARGIDGPQDVPHWDPEGFGGLGRRN